MPYIFVRGTLDWTGLFTDETFIDFQNVQDGNGEFIGAILSRQFGSYDVTHGINRCSGYPQQGQGIQQWQLSSLSPDTFCTIGVAMHPTVVLNRLEIHAGYIVVAANQQRPLPFGVRLHHNQSTMRAPSASYTLWTLHKPLQP